MTPDRKRSDYPCMIIVQARMGSTRLPGKVMKRVLNRPLLAFQVERLRQVRGIEGIIIATTNDPQDDTIASFCDKEALHCVRGSIDDVLSRYMVAVDAFDLAVAIRVTGDCPLIDPEIIEQGIAQFRASVEPLDYLSNTLERTFPRGMDFEICRAEALRRAYFEATEPSDKEHVTSYLWRHPELFRLQNLKQSVDQSTIRLTVDTQEDFELVRRLLEALYPKKPQFRLADITTLLAEHPDWRALNQHIAQKPIGT